MAEPSPNPFNQIPIEINQHIAIFLDSDFDLCNFQLICKSTRSAIHGDTYTFWRRRFLATFERPSWYKVADNKTIRKVYWERRRCLMYGAKYEAAIRYKRPEEIRKGAAALEVLKDLIVDSFSDKKDAGDETEIYVSANLDHIIKFASNHDFLNFVFYRNRGVGRRDIYGVPRLLLQTLQVVLCPLLFDLNRCFYHHSFPFSQQVVYGTADDHPIFGGVHGLDVDMEWVLHQINFWKYHMVRTEEHTLYDIFRELDPQDRPRFWNSPLCQGGNKLGAHWKGSYAYVDRDLIGQIRFGSNDEEPIVDEFNGEQGAPTFQDLRLQFVEEKDASWPPLFEHYLNSLAPPTSRVKTRAQQRTAATEGVVAQKPVNFQFRGEGHDSTEDFLAQGWLNALPPQQGIPGWQRMTMMKYFRDPDTGVLDTAALWAYEGVVLPGGQIMVGRWWAPDEGTGENMYSGPFLLWSVDGPVHGTDGYKQAVN